MDYKDMAHDAGYRGEEAEAVARALEEAEQAEWYRQMEPEPYPCRQCYAPIVTGEKCEKCAGASR